MLYDPTEHRIKSFVTRAGRLSPAQERAIQTLGPRFCVPYQKSLLDSEAAFGRAAPLILEIGTGMGETTARIAALLPDKNFLGVEVHTPGVGSLLKRMGATDWEDYAEQMLTVLSAEPSLQNTTDGYAPRPDYRPVTKFENRGLKLGHGVWDLVFTKG